MCWCQVRWCYRQALLVDLVPVVAIRRVLRSRWLLSLVVLVLVVLDWTSMTCETRVPVHGPSCPPPPSHERPVEAFFFEICEIGDEES